MQAHIEVGILFSNEIHFVLHGKYYWQEAQKELSGSGLITYYPSSQKQVLIFNGEEIPIGLPINFKPLTENARLELKNVTIGIDFHWERKEDQTYIGGLRIIEENQKLTAINILSLEDYLKSVISSEMSATSSAELLKAHAVISRSWLLAQKEKEALVKEKGAHPSLKETEGERIRWYDREDHHHFDVCADDHCQRYQGETKASTLAVTDAIDQTRGEVLKFDNKICDARYSKCCGGITELFENTWEPVHHPYLIKVTDNVKEPFSFSTLLDTEDKAEKWITQNPEAFCNTLNKKILSQVLNDYDQETIDFYRWKVEYTQKEVQQLLKDRAGLELGEILKFTPLERGVSGRLIKLKISGSLGEMTLGKELEIRKALSSSHLYSSAFAVEARDIQKGIPQKFVIKGAGWGHGVGLCQIGAAVMSHKGYSYKEILKHYFRGAVLERVY